MTRETLYNMNEEIVWVDEDINEIILDDYFIKWFS